VKHTRVALVGKSPLMLAMIETILAGHDDISVSARMQQATLRSRKLRNVDVVICISEPQDGTQQTQSVMFRGVPRTLMTIAADGKRGTIGVLRPCFTAFDELSAQSLVAAIRQAV
jgi:chemotaxis response regulator CheB